MSKLKQVANALLMVKPNLFQFNIETASSNEFQNKPSNQILLSRLHDIAMIEFDIAVETIEQCKIQIVVEKENKTSQSPDAIFPNNFVIYHQSGDIFLQKMYSSNRKHELSIDQIKNIAASCNYHIKSIIDLNDDAHANQFLEGTGSIVFNHKLKYAYAAISPRTDNELLNKFCKQIGYTPIPFHTKTKSGKSVYHTNVMLSIGENHAVICDEVIENREERDKVIKSLRESNLNIIKIKSEQMLAFCGNIIEVKNIENTSYLLMSANAYQGFTGEQKALLARAGELLPIPINTIEKISGGSIRCMVAEIFR